MDNIPWKVTEFDVHNDVHKIREVRLACVGGIHLRVRPVHNLDIVELDVGM